MKHIVHLVNESFFISSLTSFTITSKDGFSCSHKPECQSLQIAKLKSIIFFKHACLKLLNSEIKYGPTSKQFRLESVQHPSLCV